MTTVTEQKKLSSPESTQKDTRIKDLTPEQKQEIIVKGNPKIDNNVVKGYN